MIKIRVKNQIKISRKLKKSNDVKIGSLRRSKTNKSLARLIKREELSKNGEIRSEREGITVDHIKVKKIVRNNPI